VQSGQIARTIGAALLFAGTAAVVIWQNGRVGIIWDAAYILENAWRMSLGQIPYRDFPFPYAPLTYLVQAGIIALTGRIFWHHVAYTAVAAGTASVLTFRINETLLRRRDSACPSAIAFILTLPLIFLGIYCIFPHPFYDPDCCLAILFSVWLLLHVERSWRWAAAAGVALILPILIKQNIGLLYAAAAEAALVVQALVAARKQASTVSIRISLLSSWMAGALALLAIQLTCGLSNYYRWTIAFAAERRLPPFAEQLEIFRDPRLWVWVACTLSGLLAGHVWKRSADGWRSWLVTLVVTMPFLWVWYSWWTNGSLVDGPYYLITLWPFMIVVSLAAAIAQRRWFAEIDAVIPLLLIVAIEGCFLSHSAEGSSYGIWPMLLILIAAVVPSWNDAKKRVVSIAAASMISLSILVPGWLYMSSQQRLHYIDREGVLTHSRAAALDGFSVAGSYLRDFDELLDFVSAHVPFDATIVCVPGEDLFYYATARRPRFPVLLFDNTVNPYSANEIASLADRVQWVVVKKRLQIRGTPMTNELATLALLRPHFRIVGDLRNYEVWKRM